MSALSQIEAGMLAWNVWLFLLSSKYFPEFSFIPTGTQISTGVVHHPFILVVFLAMSGLLWVYPTFGHRSANPKTISKASNLCPKVTLCCNETWWTQDSFVLCRSKATANTALLFFVLKQILPIWLFKFSIRNNIRLVSDIGKCLSHYHSHTLGICVPV